MGCSILKMLVLLMTHGEILVKFYSHAHLTELCRVLEI